MARTIGTDGLTPPNRGALWTGLALTKAQLAQLCGITVRQVTHWTSRGYLVAVGGDRERYSGEAIDLCVLIKQGLDQGLPVRRAVVQARAYVADERQHQPAATTIVPPTLVDIYEQLRGAGSALGAVLQVVEPLVAQGAEWPGHTDGGPVSPPALPGA